MTSIPVKNDGKKESRTIRVDCWVNESTESLLTSTGNGCNGSPSGCGREHACAGRKRKDASMIEGMVFAMCRKECGKVHLERTTRRRSGGPNTVLGGPNGGSVPHSGDAAHPLRGDGGCDYPTRATEGLASCSTSSCNATATEA